jgi:mono/diheme cytochrome c family protein
MTQPDHHPTHPKTGRPFNNGRLLLLPLLALLLAFAIGAAAQEPVLPDTPPDAATGLSLFADRCANCHGPAGQGDGELAARLPAPPADYTDEEFRRTRLPSAMFNAITHGIIESGMPPFGPDNTDNPISEPNRWDLVAAIYSLATPQEALDLGQIVYEDNCLACHGETGLGDGPDAIENTPDLTDLAYWYNRSNETVFAALADGALPGHDYSISDEERWAVTDYSRTFSYRYANPAANEPITATNEPITAATIGGVVANATTGETVSGGQVILRAFDTNFQPTLTLTETIDAAGVYTFTLSNVMPDWAYLANTRYADLAFSSDVARLERANPTAVLPITVFEATNDPAVVNLDQMHVLLTFTGDRLQISEIYIFSNLSNRVFVGETGDPEGGTVRISLPDEAENITFQRALGDGLESAIPASEIVQLDDAWADIFPLSPGRGTLNLIASYELPYDGAATLDRPVHYPTSNASVIMPSAGVTLTGDGFVDRGIQNMGGNQFAAYTHGEIASGSTLAFSLNGRPTTTLTPEGSMVANRNETLELIIGGVALLLVGAVAGFIFYNWRTNRYDDEDEDEDDEEDLDVLLSEKDVLLHAIVDLDDAYTRGELDQETYATRRAALKADLVALWE